MANEIQGLEQVRAKMRQLGNSKLIKRASVRASRKAMNIVKKQAKENAKRLDDRKTGEKIWKNIVTKPAKTRSKNFIVMRVGIRGGAKYVDNSVNRRLGRVGQENENAGSKDLPGGDTWYWRFLEFGTSHQRATPFLRPAFNSKQEEVTIY